MPYVTTAERIGIKKGKMETAINLLSAKTFTDEQIAQWTNLDIAEVRRLRQEYAPESGQQE